MFIVVIVLDPYPRGLSDQHPEIRAVLTLGCLRFTVSTAAYPSESGSGWEVVKCARLVLG